MEMVSSWRSATGLAIILCLTLGAYILMRGNCPERPLVVQLVVPLRDDSTKELAAERENAVASLMNEGTKPDNPELVSAIRNHFIDPPSTHITKMSRPLYKTPQAETIDKILWEKKYGFFVECGALDGERSSNSIFFEQKREWTGLLVEMDPAWYLQVRGKNRKSYSINACLSPHQYPIKMNFEEHYMGEGKLVGEQSSKDTVHPVYCFPFYSLMLALNRTRIDYFSLDVEGFELDILKTIPFDQLDIATLSVEYSHAADMQKYVDFMEGKGYQLHSKVVVRQTDIFFGCKDFVFIKKSGVF